MNSGQFSYTVDGRVKTTLATPNSYAGGIPFRDSIVCVNSGGSAASYVAGLPHGPLGRLVISPNNTNPITHYVAGIGITAAGRIAIDDTAPVHHYVRGLPITATGRLAISAPALLGLFDLDADDKPDTTLLDLPAGPDVTIDEDSINIDVDGDGDADIVIPR